MCKEHARSREELFPSEDTNGSPLDSPMDSPMHSPMTPTEGGPEPLDLNQTQTQNEKPARLNYKGLLAPTTNKDKMGQKTEGEKSLEDKAYRGSANAGVHPTAIRRQDLSELRKYWRTLLVHRMSLVMLGSQFYTEQSREAMAKGLLNRWVRANMLLIIIFPHLLFSIF